MRKFTQDQWYIDDYTWCGVDKNGDRWYPVSWGDNGTAWGMTKDVHRCMSFGTVKRVEHMLSSENKHGILPLRYRYEKIELVKIKEYPTFYFDYLKIARQLNIRINKNPGSLELESQLIRYGFTPISDNPKIIVVSREEILT